MEESNTETRVDRFAEAVRTAAAEGIILLKNTHQIFPVTEKDHIALFGRCQMDYYKSGTGSGGLVNTRYTTNLVQGFRRHPKLRLNEELIRIYEEWRKEHPFDDGNGVWAAEPWHQEEMPVSEELVKHIRKQSNKAIVVIGRTAGEERDYSAVPGSYFLTEEEKDLIETVAMFFEQTAVVLNVSNIIDMSWLEALRNKEHICGVMYVWQGGIEGGNASADVMAGIISPSGKLPDTIAYRLDAYPGNACFGVEEKSYYEEDIYVGYRYFETFAKDQVQYPFGFGLSYTTFALSDCSSKIHGKGKDAEITINVTVTNTGKSYTGKEVVQVYCEAPQGRLGKPARQLVAFEKTGALTPGESQILTFSIPAKALASFDDSGVTGKANCYVLEEGVYRFYVGTDVRNAFLLLPDTSAMEEDFSRCQEEGLYIRKCTVTAELQEALAPTEMFQRLRPGALLDTGMYEKVFEETPMRRTSLKERVEENIPRAMAITGDCGWTVSDVENGTVSLEEFVAQFHEEELAMLVRAEGMNNPYVTPGTAAAFGGITKQQRHYGIPAVCAADGPSGIRMDSGKKATQMPIGTMLASSWNPAMVEELYELEGEELLQNGIDLLLGPGMNLHRHPLNGRNFEYFSEDPYVTGAFAAAVVRGIQTSGAFAVVKHFACNNQEKNRTKLNAIVSQRALREIYLKGFEIAVREGGARTVMTSYNRIGGYWSGSNYDLCTTVLRKEWGFQGIVMTDWWADLNDPISAEVTDQKNLAAMVRAQNDLYMVVQNGSSERNEAGDNTLSALEKGTLTLGELQRCAINICRFILDSPAMQHRKDSQKQADF